MKKYLAMLMILLALTASTQNALAQKGLYIGAGLGRANVGGDIGDNYNGGPGFHFLLGFKATEKTGFELEYGAYALDPKNEGTLVDEAGYGGLQANCKYFLGPRRERAFRPYVVGGLGLNAFVWKLKDNAAVRDKEDGVGALAVVPGVGFELMVGRIAALNICGRYAWNMWGEETGDGAKVDKDFSGNSLVINAGLILHL
jgi:hypothetical protein